jgi:hypothetical protein
MAYFAPRYLFRSRWELQLPARNVYDSLYALVRYPEWWPQFREVTKLDEDRYRMVVRSFLPYEISYILSRDVADAGLGTLRGKVDGDIAGDIEWRINPSPTGCVVYFQEDVVTHLDLLNLLAPIARWAFEINHQVMMNSGRVGLRAYISGRIAQTSVP